jgi:hypothetical protein
VNGGNPAFYISPIGLSPGISKIEFHSTDVAGNVEKTQSATYTITSSTTTAIASSAPTALVGKPVTFTATVTPALGGAPTGSVNFYDGTTLLATKTLHGGVATYTTSALALGTHAITGDYGGATYFTASDSPSLTQQIVSAYSTTTAIAASPAGSYTRGETITFTATVTAAVGGTPTGSVKFYDGTTLLSTETLSNGVATYATSTLALGIHKISAEYGGSTLFSPSESLTLTINILP